MKVILISKPDQRIDFKFKNLKYVLTYDFSETGKAQVLELFDENNRVVTMRSPAYKNAAALLRQIGESLQ